MKKQKGVFFVKHCVFMVRGDQGLEPFVEDCIASLGQIGMQSVAIVLIFGGILNLCDFFGIFQCMLILPYLTSRVDRLLHLPSAEAISARPNARPRM